MTLFKNTLIATALITTIGIAQARDIGTDEANKLRNAGTVKTIEVLNEAALAEHPGGTIDETELETEGNRYLYELEVVDAQGVEWDMELDATTGQVLKNHRDD